MIIRSTWDYTRRLESFLLWADAIGPSLRNPTEEAPVRADALGAAEAMYDRDLVTGGEATPAEHTLAGSVVVYLRKRFATTPLYVRVDLAPGPGGGPVVLEVEAVEPNFYLATAPPAADRLAAVVAADLAA